MKLVLGLLPCTQGKITAAGLPVDRAHLAQVRAKLGFVLQDPDAQMFMPTVYEDMLFGPMNYGLSREETERRIDGALEQLQCAHLKHRHNHRLSGGEKRMAAIATILAMRPDILLMDEPTAALDPYNRRRVIRTIQALPGTKVVTSHDLDMIYETCERVILLYEGSVCADGPAEQVLRDRDLLEQHRLELPLRFAEK
jgi:cobalt/nickel transport system ATP-binding protein